MKCQNCGCELEEGAKFCDNCGAKTEQEQKKSEPQQTAPSEEQTPSPENKEQAEQTVPVVDRTSETKNNENKENIICKKCGRELSHDARFCDNCGEKVEKDAPAVNPQTSEEQNQPQAAESIEEKTKTSAEEKTQTSQQSKVLSAESKPDETEKKKRPKFLVPLIIVIVVVAAVIALIAVIVVRRPTNVSLNEYITISASGYDTVGRATYEFDEDAFIADYQDKIKITKAGEAEMLGFSKLLEPVYLLDMQLDGYLDQTRDLSNGDMTTFSWYLDEEEIKEWFNCNLKYSDIEYVITELDPVETFNPLDYVEIEVSGISGSGNIKLTNTASEEPYYRFSFSASETSGLSNGDVVEITYDNSYSDSYWAETYGMIPEEATIEYTVEGLDSYIESFDQIPEDSFAEILAQTQDLFTASITRNYDSSYQTLTGMEYAGCYFLTGKSSGSGNILYVVYKIQAHEHVESRDFDNDFEYYLVAGYDDLIILSDGTFNVNLLDGEIVYDNNNKYFASGTTGRYSYQNLYYYYGFGNLNDVFQYFVERKVDDYTYETTFTEDDYAEETEDLEETEENETEKESEGETEEEILDENSDEEAA